MIASLSTTSANAAAGSSAWRVVGQAWRKDTALARERTLPEEVPVAFSYHGTTHAVLMATPDNLEDFAFGFSRSEGIIRTITEVSDLTVVRGGDGIELRMWLATETSDAFAARRRRFVGPSGCGMCGLESLAEANRSLPVVASDIKISRQLIEEAVAALPRSQVLHMATRAVHAAAFWKPSSGLMLTREDVGRHNAIDKLAGAMLRLGYSAADGVIVMSSRVSIELVQKASMMGAPVLIAVSAPTAYAVRAAEQAGITLIGVARSDGFEVFTHFNRIRSD
jgi:FdhD protein